MFDLGSLFEQLQAFLGDIFGFLGDFIAMLLAPILG